MDKVKKWSKNRTFDNFQINVWALTVKVSTPKIGEKRRVGKLAVSDKKGEKTEGRERSGGERGRTL